MKIDLAKLEQEPLSFDEEVELSAERIDAGAVAAPMKVRLTGSLRRQGSSYWLEGQMTAHGHLICGRCLEEVAWQASEEIAVECRPLQESPADDEVVLKEGDLDVVFVSAEELDLEDLAVEQALLALPMRVLCHDTCAGLCPRCGENRNIAGACTCEDEHDPRWGALRDMSGR